VIYLPYQDFYRSAKCLSDAHLAEQRRSVREAIQAMTVPFSRTEPWMQNWEQNVTELLWVADATLRERRRRGVDERGVVPWMLARRDQPMMPEWLTKEYHEQERMKLLHLDPTHYGRMGWR
jgi:hypothetical protein